MKLPNLPKINFPQLRPAKFQIPKFWRAKLFIVICLIFISLILGFSAGIFSSSYYYGQVKDFLSKIKIELPKIPSQTIEKEKVLKKNIFPKLLKKKRLLR